MVLIEQLVQASSVKYLSEHLLVASGWSMQSYSLTGIGLLLAVMQVEQSAVELEGDDAAKKRTHEAVKSLLLEKGLITAEVPQL